MSGLFGTLNIGGRGMSVAQKTIDVTSHNISNANTPGFSRQRAQIETSRPYGGPVLGAVATAGQVGTGAQVSAIERIRDTFLDFQVRNETSTAGKFDIRNNFLSEVQDIFNEPSDTGISTLMGKFFDSWQELSKQPQNSNARTVTAQQTVSLTDALNHTYTKLQDLKSNAQNLLKNDVTDMNSILDQIGALNKEIKTVKVSGNEPNDLMDKRDLLIDQLSNKFNLNVERKEFEGIDLKPTDTGSMKNSKLVAADDNESVMRFSYISSMEKDSDDPSGQTYTITYYKLGNMQSEDNKGTMKVTGLTPDKVDELMNSRILWANSEGTPVKGDGYPVKANYTINAAEIMDFQPQSGEIAGTISVEQDINGYIDQLNKIAKSLAYSVNAIHSGLTKGTGNPGVPDKDYSVFFVNKDVAKYSNTHELNNLDDTLAAEQDINAGNITLNEELLNDVMKIKTKTHDNAYAFTAQNPVDGESDGARALAIAKLRDTLLRVQDFGGLVSTRADMFNASRGGATLSNNGMTIASDTSGMTLSGYFKDTIDKLGVQAQESGRMVTNQESLLNSLQQSRDSVSGVSLDEEMTNLVQFQHAYNANAKIIATVDELLNVVVNGLIK
ncbi:flagellar hook-associated protein FlgK [Clostridium sp. YIM B02551]|uniref:flagellar hook-associated protein FlgK n=1 Tax=Clostridium sp. YIM B02551 TaxID=2910679 RepID=UPI001EEC11DB|nr:flagellar hook-associated protein FlgK [Clostridium sp. YIM B02551]